MPRAAGFVLCGGQSRRMGRDKALLPFGQGTLVEHVADVVRKAAGSVTLVGPAERFGALQLPIIEDEQPGLGPLGGIISALASCPGEKCLIVACDLPDITTEFLTDLIDRAERVKADCVLPESVHGLEPLCAVWSPAALPALRCAATAGRLKMREVVRHLTTSVWKVEAATVFRNVNTPEDWATRHG